MAIQRMGHNFVSEEEMPKIMDEVDELEAREVEAKIRKWIGTEEVQEKAVRACWSRERSQEEAKKKQRRSEFWVLPSRGLLC